MSKSPAMGETMEGILDSGGMPSGRLTLRSTPNREIKTKAQYSKWVVEHRNEASADALRGWRGRHVGEFKKQQADRFLKEQAQRVGDMQKQMSAAGCGGGGGEEQEPRRAAEEGRRGDEVRAKDARSGIEANKSAGRHDAQPTLRSGSAEGAQEEIFQKNRAIHEEVLAAKRRRRGGHGRQGRGRMTMRLRVKL